jgi:hypothetical protein
VAGCPVRKDHYLWVNEKSRGVDVDEKAAAKAPFQNTNGLNDGWGGSGRRWDRDQTTTLAALAPLEVQSVIPRRFELGYAAQDRAQLFLQTWRPTIGGLT